MADDTPQDPAPQDPAQPDPATGEDALGDAGKQALDRMKAERNEATKQLKALQRELEATRTANLTEAERAVAEAEKRGRESARADIGQRLVRSDFVAAAARRNPEFDASAVLDDLNLTRFVGDDGEPDTAAIGKAVERLVPAVAAPGLPSFDGGARRTAPAGADMNAVIRAAIGRT